MKRCARRLALSLATLVATLGCLGALTSATASADQSEFCAGYSGCSIAPYTTHNYQDHAQTSWWSMFAGINCTNYAAYVESQVYGVATPAHLLGDADQWAANALAQGVAVNHTPAVGAVAAWGGNAPGMTGYGHVAVVEAVGPDNSYIDISQSGMGSTQDGFSWEQINVGSDSWEPWPSSFIHFTATKPPPPTPKPGLHGAGFAYTIPGV
ncbi:MAG: CHAP domain-containing protein [Solirubrobacteraceae bacterium]